MNFDYQKLDNYIERLSMTTSAPHPGVKAQLYGFVINDIILIKSIIVFYILNYTVTRAC